MQERVVVCAWTNARQAIGTDVDLPHGWLEVTSIRIGHGDEEGEEIEDLHFVNFDALGHWAASQALRHRTPSLKPRPERVWAADQR